MSILKQTNSEDFSQKSLLNNERSFHHLKNSSSVSSITNLLNIKVQNKFSSLKNSTSKKRPKYAKFLSKSPDSHFQPMDEITSARYRILLKKIDPTNETRTSRNEGPARHRNTIKFKIHLINNSDNISVNSNQKSNTKIEFLENLSTQRMRSRTSLVLGSERAKENQKRLSLLQQNKIDKFYSDFAEKEDQSQKINSEKKDHKPKKTSIANAIKMKNMKTEYNICEELKTITSNHFFNKLKEIRQNQTNTKEKKPKVKNNIFYEELMMSHFFDTQLSEKERDEFSKFLMNDWVNKLILEKRLNDNGTMNEFLTNYEEVEKQKAILEENKKTREDFKNFNQSNKKEIFHPQSLLNKFRESIHLNHYDQIRKVLKFKDLKSYLNSKEYSSRDFDFKISQNALKKLKVHKFKKKIRKNRNIFSKEHLWEIRDSLLEYAKMVKNLNMYFSHELLTTKLPRKPFETNGSYMFLKFVKKGKISYIEKMIKENPILIFNFDMVSIFI